MESRIQEGPQKVHFFEHFSVDKFELYFRSAFLYSTNILFDKVDKLVFLRYFKDEVLLGIESLIQFYFLKSKKATYAEYFYDYFRQSIKNPEQKFSKKTILLIILLKVFLPYLKNKLDKHFTELQIKYQQMENQWQYKQQHEQQQQQDKSKNILKIPLLNKFFYRVYPTLNLFLNATNFVYNARYLLDQNSQFYDPIFKLLGQKLSRKNPLQDSENEKNQHWLTQFLKKYFIFVLFVFTKVMQWYYTNTDRDNKFIKEDIDVKDAAVAPPFKQNEVFRNNSCPICQRQINNPAFLKCSGYVFCYICIEEYVEKQGQCPVTRIPAKKSSIGILYDRPE